MARERRSPCSNDQRSRGLGGGCDRRAGSCDKAATIDCGRRFWARKLAEQRTQSAARVWREECERGQAGRVRSSLQGSI